MEEAADYLKLPTEEMCQHKLWKARLKGYELAIKQFEQIEDEKSPEWNKYLGLIHKFAVDGNIAAQEKGLEVVLAFVENAACAVKSCGEVTSGLVTKCFGSPKTKIKDKAIEILMMYVEIGKQEVVQDELVKGLSSKTPKTIIACIQTLRQALRDFGTKVITVKKFVKHLVTILEDRDKDVREEAKLLTVEVYRWIGAAFKSQLDNLKPAKLKELESEFLKLSGSNKAVPVRFLRSQQAAKNNLSQQSCHLVSEQGEKEKVIENGVNDSYEQILPVDILSQLPKNFYEKCDAKRWQERKEAVDTLLPLTSHPKFGAGEYADLIRTLQLVISKDTNVMVVAVAGKCLTGLAKGLRKRFQPYVGQCFPAVLEKFKEKKQNVVLAMREAVDAMIQSTNLDYVQDNLLEFLENKNPSIKAETAGFMARAFVQYNSTTLTKKKLQIYLPSLLKALNDSDLSVRDNAAQALGIAMKIVGEKTMMPLIKQADSVKIAKIVHVFEKARSTEIELESKRNVTGSTLNEKKDAEILTKKTDSNSKKSSNSEKECAKIKSECIMERDLAPEEVEEKAAEVIPSEVLTGLLDTNWKTRLTSVEQLMQMVSKNQTDVYQTQALVRMLVQKPGLKDSNFQVLKSKLDVLSHLATNAKFSKRSALYVLDDLADKIGDAKNGPSACETLTEIAESTTLEFVALHVFEFVFKKNRPKNQLEAINWLGNSIKEFGLIIQVKPVIDYIKKALTATSSAVRASSITLLGIIYTYMGSDLRDFFKNEKSIVLQQIDAEFQKVKGTNPPLPIRGVIYQKSLIKVDDINDNFGERIYESDSFAGIDISSQITPFLLNEMNSVNWKEKLEALQKLSDIVNGSEYIAPYLGNNLPSVLSARLMDSNKNLAVQALNVCKSLGMKMGSGCKKYVRVFTPVIFNSLGDEKASVRLAALNCLMAWVVQCGVVPFLESEMIPDAFKHKNSFLTFELLGWLTKILPTARSLPAGDLALCLPYLYSAFEDCSKDTITRAQESILPFMLHLGYEKMMKATAKLKINLQTEVITILKEAKLKLPVRKATKLKVKSLENISVNMSSGYRQGDTYVNLEDDTNIEQEDTQEKLLSCKMHTQNEHETASSMIVNKMKSCRSYEEFESKILKWNFLTPAVEHKALLEKQMTDAGFNKELLDCLFDEDFQNHLKALEIFTECLEKLPEASIANVDLILKWLSLRFHDSNHNVLIKALEYLQILLTFLYNMRPTYNLNDYEVPLFIPHLILTAGDTSNTIRKCARTCLKSVYKIYPPVKIFTYLMNDLNSPNSRLRIECLGELCSLLNRFGIDVCLPNPIMVIQKITEILSHDPVQNVRNEALNWVVQAYEIYGNQVFEYIGPISSNDLCSLKNRTMNISLPINPPCLANYVIVDQTIVMPSGIKTENLKEKLNQPENKQLSPLSKMDNVNKKEVMLLLFAAINQLGSSNRICTSVKALSQIEDTLKRKDRAGAMAPYLNDFLKAITRQYHLKLLPLESKYADSVLLLYRTLNGSLNAILSYPSLTKRASKEILKDLLRCLLRIAVDNQISEFSPDGSNLVKETNAVIIRLVERTDTTSITCSLVELLHDCVENKIGQDKLKEAVIKCLWKILKSQSKRTEDVNLREILSSLHSFLKTHSIPQWWEESIETPLGVTKTALQILVKNYGKEALNQLSLISETHGSEIEKFLKKLCGVSTPHCFMKNIEK